MRKTMENKNEKSMTLEEMISEMLKDAKVVKVPLPAKAEEKRKLRSRISRCRHARLVFRSFLSASRTCTSTWMSV
ncbi:MAG: hypothetical protein ACLTC8_14410 [Lachnospiraceae bacterium]